MASRNTGASDGEDAWVLVRNGQADRLRDVLRRAPHLVAEYRDQRPDQSLLALASAAHDAACVALLLDEFQAHTKLAEFHRQDQPGDSSAGATQPLVHESAAVLAAVCAEPEFGVDEPRRCVLRLLIRHGASVNGRNSAGWTPLLFASRHGQVDSVRELLVGKPVDFSCTRNDLDAVHMAVEGGHAAVLAELVKGGHPLRPLDTNDDTPLMRAAAYGFVDCAHILLTQGDADVNEASKYGCTPLLRALAANKYDMVEYLLEHGADANLASGEDGRHHPVLAAAQAGHLPMLRLLLDYGADLSYTSRGHVSALDLALERDHRDTVEWIERELERMRRVAQLRELEVDQSWSSERVAAWLTSGPSCTDSWLDEETSQAVINEHITGQVLLVMEKEDVRTILPAHVPYGHVILLWSRIRKQQEIAKLVAEQEARDADRALAVSPPPLPPSSPLPGSTSADPPPSYESVRPLVETVPPSPPGKGKERAPSPPPSYPVSVVDLSDGELDDFA